MQSSATMSPHKHSLSSGAPPKFVRSGQMIECLRAELLYSEKRARDFLFSAVELLLSEQDPGSPLILSRLTREAASRARAAAENAGYEFTNWDTASKAVVKAMLNAGVLISPDGTPIPTGITAQATAVARLAPHYQDLTEAFLIEFVVRSLDDVTTRDHTALAHALFRQFDPAIAIDDLEDRVVILLAMLADRVELRNERYCVRDPAAT